MILSARIRQNKGPRKEWARKDAGKVARRICLVHDITKKPLRATDVQGGHHDIKTLRSQRIGQAFYKGMFGMEV